MLKKITADYILKKLKAVCSPLISMWKKITADPGKFLLGGILASILIWTLQCSLLQNILGLDILETIIWGAQPAWGYSKHPPLSGWLGGLFSVLGGRADWIMYFACQLMIGIGVWFVYRTALLFTDRISAAAGALMLYFLVHYTPSLMKFSTYFVEMALIPLAAWSFFSALKRKKILYWLLFGVFCGLGMLNKYSFALMIAGFIIIFFSEKEYRVQWKSVGPWLAALIALALFAPHVYWLKQHDFCCLRHVGTRMHEDYNWYEPLETLIFGLYPIALAAVILVVCHFPERKSSEVQECNRPLFRWTLILSAIPIAVWFGMALCGQAVMQQWFCTMASFTALLAIAVFPRKITHAFFRWIAGLLMLVVAIIFIVTTYDLLWNTRDRIHSKPEDILKKVVTFWHQRRTDPIPVVYGDRWYIGVVENYTPERPPACEAGDEVAWEQYRQLIDEKGALLIGSPKRKENEIFNRKVGGSVQFNLRCYPCRSRLGEMTIEKVWVGYYPSRAERERAKALQK